MNAKKPAVATLSLGIPVGATSKALEAAVQKTLDKGILVVVASGPPPAAPRWVTISLEAGQVGMCVARSGDNDVDACEVAPAHVPGS